MKIWSCSRMLLAVLAFNIKENQRDKAFNIRQTPCHIDCTCDLIFHTEAGILC
jgi:hypothetical protein